MSRFDNAERTASILLQQIKNHPEYSYISVSDLIHDAGMDVDQITFKDLFHIQARVETEAKKSGIKLDYSEFDGTLSGVPFNLPAVVIRSDGVTGADFIWQSSGMITSEDICRVHTRMLQDELQIRRYNSYGFLSGSIHRLYGEPHAKLLSLLNKGMKTWDKDDYSVPLCDGSSWELRLYSRKKLVRKLLGTVVAPPFGAEIRRTIGEIIGKDDLYIF